MASPVALPPTDAYPAWLRARADADLARVAELVDELRQGSAEPLHRWNEVEGLLGGLAGTANLMAEVHPDEAVRRLADEIGQRVSRLDTELSLDVEVFRAIEAVPEAGLDALTRRYRERTLRSFRRSGVDRDEATRRRILAVSDELVALGQEFARNIREDTREIALTPDRLAGLPADWIEAHPAGPDGLVRVSTDYPDAVPFKTFAEDADARLALSVAGLQVGWPANDPVLHRLFDLRAELAGLLGYDSYADYDAQVKMIGSGPAICAFIDRIAQLAEAPALRDREVLLERLRVDRPQATSITGADVAHYAELIRRERFDVDAQEVRRYFDLAKVLPGLLAVTGELFGLSYEPVEVHVWHESVLAYDVRDADGLIGRMYLDLHPRPGKFKHAAQFGLADGVGGERPALGEGVLVCNLGTGLIEHSEVITLFHEFGHLLHHLLAGRNPWHRFAGVATEWDFVEAPSQLLEEWAWDADVLARFATDAGGQPIPAGLVARMRAGEEFGKGYQARTQMFYAALAYALHTERPADISARTLELQAQYSVFSPIPGTHLAASFGHLNGYATGYYTYMWSLVIARELFAAFPEGDLMDAEVAGRYRDAVLVPGGTKDAAELVQDFLGRPYSLDAYAAWLAR